MSSTTSHKNIWEDALEDIEQQISKANFNTWFKDTFINKINDGTAQVGVPNSFVRDWLNKKFYKTILKTLRNISEDIRSLEIVVSKKEKTDDIQPKEVQNVGELPLANYYINKEDNLNPRYTFNNFVVGPFNELAHAASQAIIKQPGIVYNPLFVYGNTGHGKTHLIQAVGNQIKKCFQDKKIYYVTSEKFTIDYVTSVQSNKINSFKEKYRKYDILIMDDIQFLSGKEKTQEELFHLFNSFYDNNKQILFSSDQHPNFIPGLEERLKSRFNQGMIVDISKPDHESRVAIIKTKMEKNNVYLKKDLYDFVATAVEGNIRELEGVVNSLICQTNLKNRQLNQNEIRDLIKNTSRPKKIISVNDLLKIISDFYNIEPENIKNKTRRKEVVRPRQIAMYILREDFNISFPTIGEKLGGRDHTTVIHSCEKIKKDLKIDNTLTQQIGQIRSMLG